MKCLLFIASMLAAMSIITLLVPSNIAVADTKIKCEKTDGTTITWRDKGHDDNSPSKSKFKELAYKADLCTLAKCVDHENCDNHTKVDWDKFKVSPAFTHSTKEQQKELKEAHKDGNGMPGLGGYEMLYAIKPDDK
jgi:hypothetical protein